MSLSPESTITQPPFGRFHLVCLDDERVRRLGEQLRLLRTECSDKNKEIQHLKQTVRPHIEEVITKFQKQIDEKINDLKTEMEKVRSDLEERNKALELERNAAVLFEAAKREATEQIQTAEREAAELRSKLQASRDKLVSEQRIWD